METASVILTRGTTRRGFLQGGIALGGLLAGGGFATAAEPKRGGVLRLGLGGASTTDTMDPTTTQTTVGANQNRQIYSCLIDLDNSAQIIPGLAESWTSNKTVDLWQFNLRKGVEFHNGKTLDAADVVYSIERHLAKGSKSPAKSLLSSIKRLEAKGSSVVEFELTGGNADFLYILSDYHLGVVPEGFTKWDAPIGTGPFVMKDYDPGVRSLAERNPNYFRDNRPYVDAAEIICINDWTARLNALQSGEVHIINRVDSRFADRLKQNKDVEVVSSPGRTHYCYVMDTRVAPFSDQNVRLALKYAIDREAILKNIFGGYGRIGNDHSLPDTDPFFSELPQHNYDPEKAKFHLKQAGLSSLAIDLSAADGAFAGAVDMALLLQSSAKPAGIDVNVIREPSDGYWDNVWMKKPFYMSWFGGRATADMILSVPYKSDSPWNDTFWKSEEFDKLLVEARSTLDPAVRKPMYAQMQRLIWETGGYLIPVFADNIDAHSVQVGGFLKNPNNELMGTRCAEQVWLES